MAKNPWETARPGMWAKLGAAAKQMRKKPTKAEAALWKAVRGDKLGANFRRQHVVDGFTTDLVCLSAQLIVEVDGGAHRDPEQASRDEKWTERLTDLGYRIVRYTNEDVLKRMASVLTDLRTKINERTGRRTPPFK